MTKEELQAIAGLLDEKLKPINDRLDKIEDEVKDVKKEVKSVKADTVYIKKQVDILYEWTDGIDLDVRRLKQAK